MAVRDFDSKFGLQIRTVAIPLLHRTIQNSFFFENVYLEMVNGSSSHSRIFHSNGDVTITGEELQILTHARYSWLLSNDGS